MQTHTETYLARPTRAEISLSRIRNNLGIVRDIVGSGVKIMAMVKSNAYGHGILKMSETLLGSGADCLGVAYLEEAVLSPGKDGMRRISGKSAVEVVPHHR